MSSYCHVNTIELCYSRDDVEILFMERFNCVKKGHDESDPIFYDLEPAVCTKNDEIKPNSKLKYDLIHVRVCRRIWYLDTQ